MDVVCVEVEDEVEELCEVEVDEDVVEVLCVVVEDSEVVCVVELIVVVE